jgi:hypothetical protein
MSRRLPACISTICGWAHLRIAGANAAFRGTVNLIVLSVRASRDVAVRLTALQSSRQLADAPCAGAHFIFRHDNCPAGVAALEHRESVAAAGHSQSGRSETAPLRQSATIRDICG